MWLDNLKELKKKTGMSAKQIAEKALLPERTVSRILAGETDRPYADTLDRIVKALGYSLSDLFADTNVVVATEDFIKTQGSIDVVEAERNLVSAENAILKDKVAALTAENDMLKMQLKHREEIIALHNYYNKLKSGD